MPKNSWIFLVLFLPMAAYSQQAEPIRSLTRVSQDLDYYTTQANLWQTNTQRSPENAEAWFNYYAAARYANMCTRSGEKPFDLGIIVDGLKQKAPNTFESYYVQYSFSKWAKENFSYLEKAYELAPARPETYSSFVTHYIMSGNQAKVKSFCKKWWNSEDHSPGLTTWNYNMLVGLESNAVLFTHGDNDTYPAWKLQEVKSFRKDVTVINTSIMMDKAYRDLLLQRMGYPAFSMTVEEAGGRTELQKAIIDHFSTKRPVYLAISAGRDLRAMIEEELYLEGMVLRYSKEPYDNVAVLVKNYEQHMLMDQFKISLVDDPAASALKAANLNYLPGLVKLLHYYRKVGDKARELVLQEEIRFIATEGGRDDVVDKYLKK